MKLGDFELGELGDPFQQPKKFRENGDAVKYCQDGLPFVRVQVCRKCDYSSSTVGEHQGEISTYFYCNLHSRGSSAIDSIPHDPRNYETHPSGYEFSPRRVWYKDCPYILEHAITLHLPHHAELNTVKDRQ